MANPSALTSTSRASCGASSTGGKLTCLCSPTSHLGSFRCTRHRNPRGRPQTSSPSPSGRASQQAASPGSSATVTRSGGMTSKGRSVLRAHLLRLVSAPSSAGRDHRRCRDFEPRPSRLGRLAATVTA